MLKIRRPLGRLIFNMGIAIPGKTVFLIETAPWLHVTKQSLLSRDIFPSGWYVEDQFPRLTYILSYRCGVADALKHVADDLIPGMGVHARLLVVIMGLMGTLKCPDHYCLCTQRMLNCHCWLFHQTLIHHNNGISYFLVIASCFINYLLPRFEFMSHWIKWSLV